MESIDRKAGFTMSQDPRGRRLSKPEKEAILNDIRSRSLSFQSISKKQRVSISTVSRLAAENGLTSPRKRSSAVEKPEHSYDREQRKSVLDRMLHSIDKMVERGGLSSRQIKDLSSATKELNTARASLDAEPDPEGRGLLGNGGRPDLDALVGCHHNGTPKNLEIYFGVLDAQEAKDKGDTELEAEAKQRVRQACIRAGVPANGIDSSAMMECIQRDFIRENGPYRGENEYA